MDQRPPTCAHRAPRLPVPCTTTSTPAMSAALHTTPWAHHPDAVYRPLPPGTAGMSRSDPGQTSTAGYSPSLYPPTSTPAMSAALHTTPWPHHPDAVYRPLPPGTAGMSRSDPTQTSSAGYSSSLSPYTTFSQMGLTSPGHIDRWWARECHDLSRFPLYYPHPLTPTMPVNPDSETQDDRFPLPQRGGMPMPGMRSGQLSAQAGGQGPAHGESQMHVYGQSQLPLPGESQGPDVGESQLPREGDDVMLGLDQLAHDVPQDMPSDDDHDDEHHPEDQAGEEHAGDPATEHIAFDHIRLMGKYICIHHYKLINLVSSYNI
jgi:hypothetical protein